MSEQTTPAPSGPPTRRALIRAVAAGGGATATAAFLAACAPGGGAGDDGGGAAAPVELPAAEVPLGGGVVLTTYHLVVTQPVPGEFHAFSAICTHQGCPVSSVEDRGVYCACHSSYFDIASGAPVTGPATERLPSVPVVQRGETLVIG